MNEIILSVGETNPFRNNLHAKLITWPITVTKNGIEYTQITYSLRTSATSRLVKLIKALAFTIFTAGLALFSKDLRKLWYKGLSGKESTIVLKPTENLNPALNLNLWLSGISESKELRQERIARLKQKDDAEAPVYRVYHCSIAYLYLLNDEEDLALVNLKPILQINPPIAFGIIRGMSKKMNLFSNQSANMVDHINHNTSQVIQNFSRLSSKFSSTVEKLKSLVKSQCSIERINYPTDLL